MFAVTDPIALPMAISALPERAAKTETIISGNVVARLTTVAPTITFGIPETSAIHAAASTNTSPPLIIRAIPIRNKTITNTKFI